jgi:ABC-type xylose transport system permease subunit
VCEHHDGFDRYVVHIDKRQYRFDVGSSKPCGFITAIAAVNWELPFAVAIFMGIAAGALCGFFSGCW